MQAYISWRTAREFIQKAKEKGSTKDLYDKCVEALDSSDPSKLKKLDIMPLARLMLELGIVDDLKVAYDYSKFLNTLALIFQAEANSSKNPRIIEGDGSKVLNLFIKPSKDANPDTFTKIVDLSIEDKNDDNGSIAIRPFEPESQKKGSKILPFMRRTPCGVA